jgi:hypothetical protein
MWNTLLTRWLRWLGGTPCLRVYGKARAESRWRILDVYAVRRRDAGSRLPLWRATCITWTDRVIAVGWDFAEQLLAEQKAAPASRDCPVEVAGGRIRDPQRRFASGAREKASASEVLAHECGHTWQALRLGPAYLPLVGALTLFREGPHPWNHFENQASEQGQFGGLVSGSVSADLTSRSALRPP